MTHPHDEDNRSVAIDSFQEWLNQTANQEDRAPEDILHRMVSTYWIVNELQESVGELPLPEDLETADEPDPEPAHTADTTDPAVDIERVIEAILEVKEAQQPDPPTTGTGIDPALLDLIRTLKEDNRADGELSVYRSLDRLEHRQESLEERTTERLRSVEAELADVAESLEDRHEALGAETREHLRGMEAELESITTEFEDRHAALKADTDDELESFKAELASVTEHLEQRQEELETRLLDRVDRIESDVTSLGDRIDQRVGTVEDRIETTREEMRGIISTFSDRVDTIEADTSAIGEELEEMDSEVGELGGSLDDVTADLHDLVGDIDHLYDRVDAELESQADEMAELRAEFSATTAEIDERMGTLADQLEEGYMEHKEQLATHDMLFDQLDDELVDLVAAREERDRLDQLLDHAQANGVSSAACEACHTDVDLTLLNSPACPECDRTFGSIRVERSFLRKRPYLTTINADVGPDVDSLIGDGED